MSSRTLTIRKRKFLIDHIGVEEGRALQLHFAALAAPFISAARKDTALVEIASAFSKVDPEEGVAFIKRCMAHVRIHDGEGFREVDWAADFDAQQDDDLQIVKVIVKEYCTVFLAQFQGLLSPKVKDEKSSA